jgi:hypothetical protein
VKARRYTLFWFWFLSSHHSLLFFSRISVYRSFVSCSWSSHTTSCSHRLVSNRMLHFSQKAPTRAHFVSSWSSGQYAPSYFGSSVQSETIKLVNSSFERNFRRVSPLPAALHSSLNPISTKLRHRLARSPGTTAVRLARSQGRPCFEATVSSTLAITWSSRNDSR